MYICFPLLAGLLPAHALYGSNFEEISFKNYIESLLFLSILITIGILSFNYFLQDWLLSGLVCSFIYFSFLYANYINIANFSFYRRSQKKHKILYNISYTLLVFIIATCIIKLKFILPIGFISKTIFWVSAILTLFIEIDIINKLINKQKEKISVENDLHIETIKNKPNIYHIVLDTHSGFTRPEYTDEWFEKELTKRGFTIYKNAKSNYDNTNRSMPSFLNYDYLENFVKANMSNSYNKNASLNYYGENKFFKILKIYGYNLSLKVFGEFQHLLAGKGSTLKDSSFASNKLLKVLCYTSIFAPKYFASLDNLLNKPLKIFKKMCLKKTTRPQYCFMHILAPHPPYFVDKDGNPNTQENYNNYNCYLGYQKYVNKKVINTLDQIMPKLDNNSIILIHSDHNIQNKAEYKFNILCCAKFPSNYNTDFIPQNVTLVNLLRYILNEIFKQNLEIIEDKHYCSLKGRYLEKTDLQSNNSTN